MNRGSRYWSDEFLDPFVFQGDREADDLFEALVRENDLETVHRMMFAMNRNDDAPPEDLPPALRDFFSGELPDWADRGKIKIAQEIFLLYGTQIVLTLFCIVLPEGYAIWKPTRILHMTNNLGRYVHRRVVETAQFLLDVMSPGGLEPGGRGIRSIQKVRLIHSAARYFVSRNPAWKSEWGTPINQEDMAATIGGFSFLSLEGLEKLNMRLTAAEQDAYLHCWRVVGHLIGVEPELYFRNMEHAGEFFTAYRRRNRGGTPQGVELTTRLTDFMNSRLPRLMRGLPEAFIIFFLGRETARMVGIAGRRHALLKPFRGMAIWMHRVQKQSRRLSRLSSRMTWAILERLLALEIQDAPVRFDLPIVLRRSWNIEAVYRRVRRLDWRMGGRVDIVIGEMEWEARPINISRKGIRLRLIPGSDRRNRGEVPPLYTPGNAGRPVRLRFRLPPEPEFEAGALLLRLAPSPMGPEVGLSFTELTPEAERGLENILRGALEQSGTTV